MGLMILVLIDFLSIVKTFAPILAAIYTAGFGLEIFCPDFFETFHKAAYFLPDFFENIFGSNLTINGGKIHPGYIYSALFCVVLTFCAMAAGEFLEKIEKRSKIKQQERKFAKLNETKAKRQQERKEILMQKVNCFYGLFELKLKYFDGIKEKENLENLKHEYCRMTAQKLREKYPHIKFLVSKYIFIVSYDFYCINTLPVDIVKLFKIFQNADNKKFIQTDLLLSFHTDNNITEKKALKVLEKINEANFTNKVNATNGIYKRYCLENKKYLDFIPAGNVMIEENNKDENNIIELFNIKKTQ